jgi:hypothetical protein
MPNAAGRAGQRGEGHFSTFIALLALGAFLYAAVNVGPAYFADYALGDEMREIARLGRGMYKDDAIRDRLMRAVSENGLEGYIDRSSFEVDTRDSTRRIKLEYEREVKILPGWTRTVLFSHEVDEPFF